MNQMCYLNRKRLLDYLLIHGGPVGMNIAVVLQGGKSSNFYDTDVENLFRQESFFQWCFDVDIPDCYAAILFDRGSKFRSVLFVPKMPPDFEIWVGRMPTFDQLKDKYSVDEVHYIDNIVEYLVSYNVGKVHTLKGTNSDSNLNHFGVDLDLSRFQVDTEHLHEMMSDLRVYKTEYEVEMIKKATEVTLEAHKAVMLYCKPDMYEYELEAKFLQSIYKTNGCRFVSYTCICASGVNNQILHYGHAAAPNNKQIKKGDLCLFDMGANYKGYASDITCTFPVNGTFSVEQRIIYNIVLNINRTIIATLRPGVSWVSMHVKSLRLLIEALQSIGVLNSGNVKQMIADGVGATFQPHGIGHLIGLDVHDVGAYLNKTPPRPDHIPGVKKLRTSRILEFRMCLTVEPGCYFNECLLERARNSATLNPYFNWEQIEKFKYVGGVRIEDIVLITEKGCELLSADVPREVEEIESFLRLRPYLD